MFTFLSRDDGVCLGILLSSHRLLACDGGEVTLFGRTLYRTIPAAVKRAETTFFRGLPLSYSPIRETFP